jgi:hypothetical protein
MRTAFTRAAFRRFHLAFAASLALFVGAGCGGSEPAAPPAAPAPAAEAPAAAAPAEAAQAIAAPAAAVATDAPATVRSLGFMPASAQVGLALPALNGVVDTLLALDSRIPDVDLAGELAKIVDDLKRDAGTPEADSLGAIALAKGLSLDAPIAVFADLTESAEGFKQALAEAQEGAEPDMGDVDVPALAAVLGVSDQEKAQATLNEVIAMTGIGAETSEDVGGVAVKTHGDYAYFFSGDQLVLGMTAMVKAAAERVASPATFRYGTAACPPTAPQEAVAVMYGDRALPLLREVLPALANDEMSRALMSAQMAQMEKAFGSGSQDPIVMNLSLGEQGIALTSRVDTAEHPGLLEVSGTAKPFELAQRLPGGTLAMLSLALTDEFKKQINEQVLPAANEAVKDPGMAQGLSMGRQVVEMLGNEVVIGISEVPNDFPAAYIMLSLSNPEPTKGLLQMLVPMMPDPELTEFGISSVAAPIPVPLSIAFEGNMVLVSNSVDGMKDIITMSREGKTSELFGTLGLDPAVPRYQALVLDSRLISDIVVPLSSLQGGLPDDVAPIADVVGALVRDVRLLSEMDGSWWTTSLSVALKDAA